jgi:hypothetical protein
MAIRPCFSFVKPDDRAESYRRSASISSCCGLWRSDALLRTQIQLRTHEASAPLLGNKPRFDGSFVSRMFSLQNTKVSIPNCRPITLRATAVVRFGTSDERERQGRIYHKNVRLPDREPQFSVREILVAFIGIVACCSAEPQGKGGSFRLFRSLLRAKRTPFGIHSWQLCHQPE